jgi:hypothetical protein
MLTRDTRECWCTGLLHDVYELALEDIKHGLDATLAECRQTPPLRSANPNRSRTERERFENVSSAAHTPIKKNGCTTVDGIRDFRKAFNSGAQRFFLPAAVIGDDDAIDTMID